MKEGIILEYIKVIVETKLSRMDTDYFQQMGHVVGSLPMINSLIIEVDAEQLENLKNDGVVVEVIEDSDVFAQMDMARRNVNAERILNRTKFCGRGVNVAIVDTGVDAHQDFKRPCNRLVHQEDLLHYKEEFYDDCGHGTHVAGILAGSGFVSKGKYMGIAPMAGVVSVKVLNDEGRGKLSDVLSGIQWVYDNYRRYNIRIVNISVGMTDRRGEESILVKAVNRLWDEGIVVVTAAGNKGPALGSILSPGISSKVITVGCSNDHQQVEIDGQIRVNYSSRGPTREKISKPDLISPGSNIIACAPGESAYTPKSGTSMSTPMVSGAIALYLQKNPHSTPDEIKEALADSCDDMGLHEYRQGQGLLNVERFINKD